MRVQVSLTREECLNLFKAHKEVYDLSKEKSTKDIITSERGYNIIRNKRELERIDKETSETSKEFVETNATEVFVPDPQKTNKEGKVVNKPTGTYTFENSESKKKWEEQNKKYMKEEVKLELYLYDKKFINDLRDKCNLSLESMDFLMLIIEGDKRNEEVEKEKED